MDLSTCVGRETFWMGDRAFFSCVFVEEIKIIIPHIYHNVIITTLGENHDFPLTIMKIITKIKVLSTNNDFHDF